MSVMELKAAVHKALERIGRVNGTAAPKSQDTGVELLHEFAVAEQIRAYGNKRYDDIKEQLLATHETAINKVRDMAKRMKMPVSEELMDAEWYKLRVNCKSPVVQIDQKKFISGLIAAGVKQAIIDKCLADAQKTNAAATSLEVIDA